MFERAIREWARHKRSNARAADGKPSPAKRPRLSRMSASAPAGTGAAADDDDGPVTIPPPPPATRASIDEAFSSCIPENDI